MVSYNQLRDAGAALAKYAEGNDVPYVPGGMALDGMDCQGLVEYLLAQCGVRRNWRGSNDMWRSALKWSGTPEAAVERFGALPPGAGVFIVQNDGGEPDDYKRTDMQRFGGSKGNASHVGLWLGNGKTVHASASVGRVCVSTKFDGARAVPNGGWNMVGLWDDVMYSEDVERELMRDVDGDAYDADGADTGAGVPRDDSLADIVSDNSAQGLTAGTPPPSAGRYAIVSSLDGNPVKLRKSASKGEPVYWRVNSGAQVRVERDKDGWSLITAICADGRTRRAYMQSKYLV